MFKVDNKYTRITLSNFILVSFVLALNTEFGHVSRVS